MAEGKIDLSPEEQRALAVALKKKGYKAPTLRPTIDPSLVEQVKHRAGVEAIIVDETVNRAKVKVVGQKNGQ